MLGKEVLLLLGFPRDLQYEVISDAEARCIAGNTMAVPHARHLECPKHLVPCVDTVSLNFGEY